MASGACAKLRQLSGPQATPFVIAGLISGAGHCCGGCCVEPWLAGAVCALIVPAVPASE